MGTGEFAVIEQCFRGLTSSSEHVRLGIGDDCALIEPPPGQLLAVTTDTLVAGVHFPVNTNAADIGYKSLAVNLSDLAAMAARPAWVTLALTLPSVGDRWLREFTREFGGLADRHQVALVGGDLTRGPLTVTVQAMGTVAPERAITRCGASPGDFIYVTGTLGDAAAGLALFDGRLNCGAGDAEYLRTRLSRPEPRVEAGQALAGLGSAAIDVSDGLCQDLGHILRGSGVGATLEPDSLPLSSPLRRAMGEGGWELAMGGGDDYELCFTVPPTRAGEILDRLAGTGTPVTRIGVVEEQPGLRCDRGDGRKETLTQQGYRHF